MFTELGHAEPFQDSQGRGQKCKVAVERFDCSVGLRVGWGTLGATNPGWRQVGWHEAVPSKPPTYPPPPAQSNDTPSSQSIFSNTRLLQVSPSSALVRMTHSLWMAFPLILSVSHGFLLWCLSFRSPNNSMMLSPSDSTGS